MAELGVDGTVKRQYEASRERLIDLSGRNRMLNFRATSRRAVVITGEESDKVYERLVDQERKFGFSGIAPDDALGLTPADQELLYGTLFDEDALRAQAEEEVDLTLGGRTVQVDARHSLLGTQVPEKELQKTLAKIAKEARELREETGLDALYLAMGSVEWIPVDRDAPQRAPLLFVPVEIITGRGGKIQIAYTGGPIGDNLSLVRKLQVEFDLALPRWQTPETASFGVVHAYVDEVRRELRAKSAWRVERDWMALSFFQFEKLVMYQDLDESEWPEDGQPTADPDLRVIFGGDDPGFESPFSEADFLDPFRPVAHAHEVVDCDSSQALALLRAQTGQSIVIQGPPGTGKSQTILNLIAQSVIEGKRVLFVAAKEAALQVVLRKMQDAGLGDLCLNLHSKSAKPKEFYGELRRVLETQRIRFNEAAELDQLQKTRDDLNGYCEALHRRHGSLQISAYEAMGLLANLPPESLEDRKHAVPYSQFGGKAWPALRGALEPARAYQDGLRATGTLGEHPFYRCRAMVVTASTVMDTAILAEAALARLGAARAAGDALSAALGLQGAVDVLDLKAQVHATHHAAAAPDVEGMPFQGPKWETAAGGLREALEALAGFQRAQREQEQRVLPTFWDGPVRHALPVFEAHAGKWYRLLIGEFRDHRQAIRGHLVPRAVRSDGDLLTLLRQADAALSQRDRVEAEREALERHFGPHWRGMTSDPAMLESLLDWVLDARRQVAEGALPAGYFEMLQKRRNPNQGVAEAGTAREQWERAEEAIHAAESLVVYEARPGIRETFEGMAARLGRWQSESARLHEVASLNAAHRRLQEHGFGFLEEVVAGWPEASEKLTDLLVRSIAEGHLQEVARDCPEFGGFSRELQRERLENFRRRDRQVLEINRQRVRRAHLDGLPAGAAGLGQWGTVLVEMQRQRGHRPVRWALERAGAVIQKVKPVFMMSPLTVSRYLPRGDFRFDLVIFDEASQIPPEDALPAIIRAAQTVVVGDSEQLPPTTFFSTVVADDAVNLQEDEAATAQTESILSLFAARWRSTPREAMLRWHYRSKHPDLIRPSNHHSYDNKLVVFPHPTEREAGDQGLFFHYDRSHAYQRSGNQANPAQAEAVARAVVEHLRRFPDWSLGVAAFSRAQEEALEAAIERALQWEQDLLMRYRLRHPHEPLFVRNLERIQGDERDAIMISIGYGPDERGRMHQNFGPINGAQGKRRLNVLMSRARQRCDVFSSIRSGDVTLADGGVHVFHSFLRFAETGLLDDPKPTRGEVTNAFEDQVAAAIRGMGYEVHAQVGSIGYAIDLAVVHPEEPGRYVLAVECDGATYHSARSARDRDRLRQEALEARGWRFHRVWSTAWWKNREGEVQRLTEAILMALAETPEPVVPPAALGLAVESAPPAGALQRPPAYILWDGSGEFSHSSFEGMSPEHLATVVIDLVNLEGPVHVDAVVMRIREAAGFARAGNQIRDKINLAIELATLGKSGIIQSLDFLLKSEGQKSVLRDWGNLSPKLRRMDWVSPTEVGAAISWLLGHAHGIRADDLVREVGPLLGFARTDAWEERARAALAACIQAQVVEEREGLIYLSG